MVQVFTDALLAHVCVFVCCLLHESIVGSDMFQGCNGFYKESYCGVVPPP
jgi:hypothetical protein